MKILLLYPTITVKGKDTTAAGFIPSLGLAYLAAVAEQKGHDVKIIDCVAEGNNHVTQFEDSFRFGLPDDKIRDMIIHFSPDIVGMSSLFSAYAEDMYRLARLVKTINDKIIVIAGGAHVCALPEKVLAEKAIDICILGEGEITFVELVEKIKCGEDCKKIDGIAYRDTGGKIVYTKERALIKDLDSLPFPARHLLPMETYFSEHKNPYAYHSRHTFMITSRGCPMKCVYCSIHSVWKHRWRARSAENIVDEIEHLINQYGVKEIHFVDDNLTANRKRAKRLFELIIERNIKVKWTCPNGTAVWTLDEELLRLMKKSGCYRLTFGIESGSNITQQYIKKKLDLEKAKANIAIANRIGLWTVSTFIFGFPYQNKEQIEASIQFAIDSGTDFATFYALMPFPATELWESLKREKLIDESEFFDDIGYYLSSRGLDTKYFTHSQIQTYTSIATKKMIRSNLKKILINPIHYARKISSIGDIVYFLKLFRQYSQIIINVSVRGAKTGGSVYWKKAMTRE